MNVSAKDLIVPEQHDEAAANQYNVIGNTICMGDHKVGRWDLGGCHLILILIFSHIAARLSKYPPKRQQRYHSML